jgi:hypothetical protein
MLKELDSENESLSFSQQSFCFTAEDDFGQNTVIDAGKDVQRITNETAACISITPTLDYLFLSASLSQPFNFLKPSQAGIEPNKLYFCWKNRNTYLSTKMVYEFFPNCKQIQICTINSNKEKGTLLRYPIFNHPSN